MEGEDDVPTATQLMTAAEFLALPQDDGIDRMLLAGELLESPMVYRNRLHSRALTRMARFLDVWLDSQPEPQGQVLAGDAGVKLTTNPDTLFGVDVAYFTADVLQVQPRHENTIVVGVPRLAVEILTPGEVIERHNQKVDAYLSAGVNLVWVLDPHRQTVLALRPTSDPVLFSSQQLLQADDVLPGFRVMVSELFA